MQFQLKLRKQNFIFLLSFCFIILLSSCQKDQTQNFEESDTIESKTSPIDIKEDYFKDDSFNDMIFDGEERNVFEESNLDFDFEESIILKGILEVSQYGEVTGQLKVSSVGNNTNGTLELDKGSFIFQNEIGIIHYNPFDGSKLSRGDGQILELDKVAETYSKLKKNNISNYPLEVQFLSSFLTLTTSKSWAANTQFAKTSGIKDGSNGASFKGNCDWWDRTRAGAVATFLAAGPASICASIIGVCAGATAVTLGWVAVPCVVIVGFCGATVGFAWTATYDYMLDNWLCPPEICTFAPPSVVYTSSSPVNGRVTLQWYSVSGAQSYQVVQDIGYAYTLATTTGTSMTISGMSRGWYRFGVRTVCNNTATAGITWTWVYNP